MDETYIKVKGEDGYLYRAVDPTGQKIDFLLTLKRDPRIRSRSSNSKRKAPYAAAAGCANVST